MEGKTGRGWEGDWSYGGDGDGGGKEEFGRVREGFKALKVEARFKSLWRFQKIFPGQDFLVE